LRTIDKGDTLSKLAADALGDPGAWRAIAEANDIDNPRTLDPGRTLVIPPREPRPPY
jgi:nucleoid-associated protein YgaU